MVANLITQLYRSAMEEEIHFLFVCPLLSSVRMKFIVANILEKQISSDFCCSCHQIMKAPG